MRKLIALVFHYSLNGLLADEGTEYFKFCFDLLDLDGGRRPGRRAMVSGRVLHCPGWTIRGLWTMKSP